MGREKTIAFANAKLSGAQFAKAAITKEDCHNMADKRISNIYNGWSIRMLSHI
jgi:hypothetical protein